MRKICHPPFRNPRPAAQLHAIGSGLTGRRSPDRPGWRRSTTRCRAAVPVGVARAPAAARAPADRIPAPPRCRGCGRPPARRPPPSGPLARAPVPRRRRAPPTQGSGRRPGSRALPRIRGLGVRGKSPADRPHAPPATDGAELCPSRRPLQTAATCEFHERETISARAQSSGRRPPEGAPLPLRRRTRTVRARWRWMTVRDVHHGSGSVPARNPLLPP